MSDYYSGLKDAMIVEAAELHLVAILKPTLSKDGNQWCYLLGENLQEGIAGFGDTPYKAAVDFSRAYKQDSP